MRIALFTETYLPSINGVVTHVKTLKEGLEALGHTVLVVTADSRVNNHVIADDVMYCPAVKLKKIYNYDIAPPISKERLDKIKSFAPDIIHIHNEFGVGISGVLIARTLKVPLVYTLHTMYDDYVYYVAKTKGFGKIVTSASHLYAKMLASTASAITGPSPKVSEYFKACGVKKPVHVIPNSVELDVFKPENVDSIVSINVFGLEYVRPEDKIKLFILGDGPLHEQHCKEADELGISDMVKFAGRVEHPDLPVYYACCDAYITASLSDTCSISMLEGMAMHLPVLSLKDDLNVGQVKDGVNGYNFTDADSMYELLKKLRDMPKDELAEFGRRTRESIITSGAVRLANDLLDVYKEAIEVYKKKNKKRKLKKRYRVIRHRYVKRSRTDKN